ncbi:MAG: hypothetical protein D6752_01220 [Candidatus Nitrosothermus koennekii]|nr:MAG: hypothetical protein D6752_01220 [Candidatus Nitrosothermus koennekii]
MNNKLLLLPIIAIPIIILTLSKEDYALEVDAINDPADLANFYRIVLTNKGSKDLTDIIIDFGSYQEKIPRLSPNERIVLSPKEVSRDYIIVTTAEGINIKKEFRVPSSLPGHH